MLNVVDFAWGMSRNATWIRCAGASRNATQALRRDGDAVRREKTARALKFVRMHFPGHRERRIRPIVNTESGAS
jgi:hypothetical protein